MRLREAVIAANRFGLGARRGEIRDIASDPRGWLLGQLQPEHTLPEPMRALPSTASDSIAYIRWAVGVGIRTAGTGDASAFDAAGDMSKPRGEEQDGIEASFRATFEPRYERALKARIDVARQTSAPFFERLVHFWSNHFAISAQKAFIAGLPPSFERDVARRHASGSFESLLLASSKHPGMLYYLDNWISIGPNSRWGRNHAERPTLPVIGAPKGLNENLAREILELHSIGVQGGYTQADVTELARILTGWTVRRRAAERGTAAWSARRDQAVERLGAATPESRARMATFVAGLMDRQAAYYDGEPLSLFAFEAHAHEPGERSLLGRQYEDAGLLQGERALRDIARHPATATFVASKLVRHFVSDSPPPPVVKRAAAAFLASDGAVGKVMEAIIQSPETWDEHLTKFKRPEEYVISVLRAFPEIELTGAQLRVTLEAMGQKPYNQPAPDGWPDDATQWLGADGLWKRIEWALDIASHVKDVATADTLAQDLLGDQLSAATSAALRRATDSREAVGMLLVSPEFHRR